MQALITLYGGAVFSLVTAPAGAVTPELAAGLARCIVAGVVQGAGAPQPGSGPG